MLVILWTISVNAFCVSRCVQDMVRTDSFCYQVRKQFGKALAQFQHLQFELADMVSYQNVVVGGGVGDSQNHRLAYLFCLLQFLCLAFVTNDVVSHSPLLLSLSLLCFPLSSILSALLLSSLLFSSPLLLGLSCLSSSYPLSSISLQSTGNEPHCRSLDGAKCCKEH